MQRGNFKCDRKSKELFCSIMEDKFYRVITDIPEDEYSSNDIYMTGLTSTGKIKTYAIELKDRKGNEAEGIRGYKSTDYGTSARTEGHIIEDRKVRNLEEATNSGYTPIYAMFFDDDVLAVWDLSRMPDGWQDRRDSEKTYHLHTVDNEGGTYRKAKIGMWFKDCVMILKYDKERDNWGDCRKRYS